MAKDYTRQEPYSLNDVIKYIPDPITEVRNGDMWNDAVIYTSDYHIQVGTREGYMMACTWHNGKLFQMDPVGPPLIEFQIKTIKKGLNNAKVKH